MDRPSFYTPTPRGFEKEIFVSFGDTAVTQSHNFCGAGDIDLAYFRFKKDRWYRVFTNNLAPGVDTVMAVGDVGGDARCFPAGCWNDDRGAGRRRSH